jgi:hypothetical protein
LFHHIDLILDVNIFLYLSPQGKQTRAKRQNEFYGYFWSLYTRARIYKAVPPGVIRRKSNPRETPKWEIGGRDGEWCDIV